MVTLSQKWERYQFAFQKSHSMLCRGKRAVRIRPQDHRRPFRKVQSGLCAKIPERHRFCRKAFLPHHPGLSAPNAHGPTDPRIEPESGRGWGRLHTGELAPARQRDFTRRLPPRACPNQRPRRQRRSGCRSAPGWKPSRRYCRWPPTGRDGWSVPCPAHAWPG